MLLFCKVGDTIKVPVYLVDATDGYTPETNVVTPTIYISKNGNEAAAPNDGAWVQISSANMPGHYTAQLNATDTNTAGVIQGNVIKTGISRHFPFTIVIREKTEKNVYDKTGGEVA